MCGIAGFLGAFAAPRPAFQVLDRMIGAIAHRGPDDRGLMVDGPVGLAHARLSIIDLASGHQPMASPDRATWVVFNGEIFNHVELRRDLAARGHRFRTRSDTEVILAAYEAMGPDCVNAFNGDFALAIWDGRQRRLMLARDRLGVRPLYYTRRHGTLFFASEVKALLAAGLAAEIDPVALDQIFTLWFPLAPRTPFKGIVELPPGHLLMDADGHMTVRPYWRLSFPDAAADRPLDAREERRLAEETLALLRDAVAIRLRSDVPVGAYLSGGLDSSIIAAAAKSISPDRLTTFSVTFEAPEFDESRQQQEMVRALATDHRSVACAGIDIARLFPTVVRHAEQPMLRTAPAPLFALSRLVHSRGFKVVLTGEGADEVFAGYDIFKEAKLRRFCARQPGSRRRPLLFERLYPYLPGLHRQPQAYRASFFTAGGDTVDPLYSHLPRFRSTAGAKAVFSDSLREALADYDALAELRESLPADFIRWHPLSQAQYLETAHLLPGYILSSQGDRMAMANGVEGRFPFLDHRLVEFAAGIPPRLKLRILQEKHILREAARDLLPAPIAARPKQPYRAPEAECFLCPEAPAYVADCLAPEAIAASGFFDPAAVDRLIRKCRSHSRLGFRDNAAIVGILSTQLWQRAFAGPTGTKFAAPALEHASV